MVVILSRMIHDKITTVVILSRDRISTVVILSRDNITIPVTEQLSFLLTLILFILFLTLNHSPTLSPYIFYTYILYTFMLGRASPLPRTHPNDAGKLLNKSNLLVN